MKVKVFVLYFLSLLFMACSNDVAQYKKTVFDEKNIPLSIHFNETKAQILSRFGKENLRDENADFLFYDISLKGNDSYTYAFKFYNDTLYGLEVGLFIQNPKQANALFTDVTNDLNDQISQHKKIDNRAFVWYVRDSLSNKNTEIEWRNESAQFGVLTMLYNNIDF